MSLEAVVCFAGNRRTHSICWVLPDAYFTGPGEDRETTCLCVAGYTASLHGVVSAGS